MMLLQGKGKAMEGVQDSVAKLAEGGDVGNKCKRSYTHNQELISQTLVVAQIQY